MSHVKRLIGKCLIVLMAVLFVWGMAIPACAASNGVEVSVSVSQIFVNYAASEAEDTFSYVLTPKKTDHPMPEQSVEGYAFTINGTEEVKLPEIVFTQAGTYTYELKQNVESPRKGYTYDEKVYAIEIHVTNTGDGGLTAAAIVYAGSDGKTDRIVFANSYRKEADPGGLPQTGDNNNSAFWLIVLTFAVIGWILMWIMRCKTK